MPIQELNSNSGASKLSMLVNNYNHYLNMIRDVTGLNEARDGSTPDPNSLVGVQKLAALNSNTATRHILNGSLYIIRTLAEGLTYRVSDLLEYTDFAEEFTNQIVEGESPTVDCTTPGSAGSMVVCSVCCF